MIDVRVVGEGAGHDVLEQAMHRRDGLPAGAVVYTERFLTFNPEFHPFLNDTFGAAMNQNVTFGTVAVNLHNGGSSSSAKTGTADGNTLNELVDSGGGFNAAAVVGSSVHNTTDDTYGNVTAVTTDTRLTFATDLFPDGNENYTIDLVWAGTAVAGTWNFADSGKVSLTTGDNGDEASFDANASTSLDMDNFTAFTGKVDLDTFAPVSNDVLISFGLNGVLAGNAVLLSTYIDTGDFSEQTFVIPKVDLGLTGQTVNDMTLFLVRTGGPKPTLSFDDMQLEASGTPAVFKATTPAGTKFHITELRVALADNITGITTVASGTETATVPNLGYDDFMGITSPLTNGVVFTRVQAGKVAFSVTLKQLGDFLATGSNLINHISDGTNSFIALQIEFPEPIILDGSKDDFLSYTINDDLSGLLQFTAAARGAVEV